MARIPDTFEILNTGLGQTKPSLGDPSTVEGLVRDLMHKVTQARIATLEGGDDQLPALKTAAQDFQDVFYGKGDAHIATAWHSPKYLGAALVDQSGIGGSADDAVYRVALRIMREVTNILAFYEEGQMTDPEMRDAIDTIVEVYRTALMGIPASE